MVIPLLRLQHLLGFYVRVLCYADLSDRRFSTLVCMDQSNLQPYSLHHLLQATSSLGSYIRALCSYLWHAIYKMISVLGAGPVPPHPA